MRGGVHSKRSRRQGFGGIAMIKPNKNAHLLSDLLKKVDEMKPNNEAGFQVSLSSCFKKKFEAFFKPIRGASDSWRRTITNGNDASRLSRERCRFGRDVAFTLAEVLVTLGIIGVVAAMTLPSVISNYKKNVAETRLKHAYSLITQAIQIAEYENEIGFPFEIGEAVNPDVNGYSWENSQKLYELYFKKHIVAQKTYPKSYKPAYNHYTYGLKERYPVDNFSYYAELGNGVLLGLVRNSSKSFSWYIILDKNAKQLVRGKNYFYIIFTLTKNGYVNEWYKKFSTEQLYEHCGSNTNNLLAFVRQQGSCMEIIRRNSFNIPKDYPIPF